MVNIHLTVMFAVLGAMAIAIPSTPGFAAGMPIEPRTAQLHADVSTQPLPRGVTYVEPAEPQYTSYVDIAKAVQLFTVSNSTSFDLINIDPPAIRYLSERDADLPNSGGDIVGVSGGSAGKNAPILKVDTGAAEGIAKAAKIGAEGIQAIAGLVHVAIKAGKSLSTKDKEFRNDWVKSMLATGRQMYPGYNIMIYHRFHEKFVYTIDDPSTKAEVTFPIKRKDLVGSTEFYNVIVFKGAGTLLNKGDGGHLNWGFAGNYDWNGGRFVQFH